MWDEEREVSEASRGEMKEREVREANRSVMKKGK